MVKKGRMWVRLSSMIIGDNPCGCTSDESAGVPIAIIDRGTEHYIGKIVCENAEEKTVGAWENFHSVCNEIVRKIG